MNRLDLIKQLNGCKDNLEVRVSHKLKGTIMPEEIDIPISCAKLTSNDAGDVIIVLSDKGISDIVIGEEIWHFVERPDEDEPYNIVFGDPINDSRGVMFKNRKLAREYHRMELEGKVIGTPVGYHPDDCCGCVHFYFSRERQNIVFVCNECGMKREMLTENVCGDIIGASIPLKDKL